MRSKGQVKKRLKQVRFKHQKKFLESHLKRKPCNCKWNSEQKYVHEGTGQLRVLGMCMYSVENPDWDVDICEVIEQAQKCPNFSPPKSKDELKEEFEELCSDEEFVNTHFKDVAALKWVLNGDGELFTPWYQRFWRWVTFAENGDRGSEES